MSKTDKQTMINRRRVLQTIGVGIAGIGPIAAMSRTNLWTPPGVPQVLRNDAADRRPKTSFVLSF